MEAMVASADPADRSTAPGATRPGGDARREAWYDAGVAFVRWDPLHDLLALQQRMNRLTPGPTGWTPPVDIFETADCYVVLAEVPGLSREDVHIQMHEGGITLSGARLERAAACEQYHRIERGHGSFSRTFRLPVPVDPDRVTADLKHGVLTVTCPKRSDGSTRRITIG